MRIHKTIRKATRIKDPYLNYLQRLQVERLKDYPRPIQEFRGIDINEIIQENLKLMVINTDLQTQILTLKQAIKAKKKKKK